MGERMKKLTTASSRPSGAPSYLTYVNLPARPTLGYLKKLGLTSADRMRVSWSRGGLVSEWLTNVENLSKCVAVTEQRQTKGHFQLIEAAQVLADEHPELDAVDLNLAMCKAVRTGRLSVRDDTTGLRKEPHIDVRFTASVFVVDIDDWLSLEQASYRFPKSERKGRASALTPDQKVEVGKLLAEGVLVTKLAERFGVSRRTIDKCKPSAKAVPPAPGLKDVWKPSAQSKRT
jgi:Helix-turn-helix domain of resolvase